MLFKNLPIRKKILRIVFLINGIVLLVACGTLFVYENYVFRKSTVERMSTIGKIVAANSSASLAFDNPQDAKEILAAIRNDAHVVDACLFDNKGSLFARYGAATNDIRLPDHAVETGYRFRNSHLEGFERVMEGNRQLGTLYLKSDLGALYSRLNLYGVMVAIVLILSFGVAYLLVRVLKVSISTPILSLAETAKMISDKQDYSVRAVKMGSDELGSLTEAFNHMLDRIQQQNERLKEFNQTLEQKVADRTVKLESVNKELESFSYSVSHDLRAPLRAVIGFASILEEDYGASLDGEGQRITGVIKKNTLKMGHLIDDLLTFSRVSRQDIATSTIDMASMVDEVRESLAQEQDTSNVEWAIQSLPPVSGNANMIKQVWVNLMSNAIKYSGKKENACVEIGSFRKDRQIAFFVRDNGVGFDRQYSNKLFKVFQRLHNEDEFEGTGIGLALVEKIISRHGGHVWAEGEPGEGACFYFSLP
ncbi:MAG: ATP-binding protein [Bacteroidota bacterium]|nr:ATP-binding protein [Bacteroidota bacterium]MDP4218635.1 ATP-binding protein [Bacteroidota bacterium]MDP4246768.1 ATP-binding protein [Bacteroidota bacterium]MDP4253790.1 ATP-binding protein [Bacteroidota bacterium]MDP4259600.1 ATP-binding protein [Bacteroidota bacterium]